MGGGSKGGSSAPVVQPTVTPSPYEESLANIANQTYSTTNPLRKNFISSWEQFFNPTPVLKAGATPQAMIPQYSTTAGTSGTPTGWQDIATGQIYGKDLPGGYTPQLIDNWVSNAEKLYSYQNGNNSLTLRPYDIGAGTAGSQQITGYTPQYGADQYVTQRFNPANLPGYTPTYDISRRGVEAQYNQAVNQAIGQTPRGGALSDALTRLNLGRAESVGQLPGQISSSLIQDQLNKAYGAAFNAPSQAISGLSAANQGYVSTQNALLNAQMQQSAINAQSANAKGSGLGALGMGVGTVVGSALGSPGAGASVGGALGKLGGK
jgi:hypothetical protein